MLAAVWMPCVLWCEQDTTSLSILSVPASCLPNVLAAGTASVVAMLRKQLQAFHKGGDSNQHTKDRYLSVPYTLYTCCILNSWILVISLFWSCLEKLFLQSYQSGLMAPQKLTLFFYLAKCDLFFKTLMDVLGKYRLQFFLNSSSDLVFPRASDL